jgi:stearoyl-CoA desaturase (delta-9 desaturase)
MATVLDAPTSTRRRDGQERSHDELAAGAPSSRSDEQRAIMEWFAPENLAWSNVDWVTTIWMVAIHAGALAAPFFFTWEAVAMCAALWWATGSLGICLCYHRYLSHRSLKLAAPVDFFVLLWGVLAGQGSPLSWTAMHRVHHQRSDREGDPHSPLDGKWWSHLMWLFVYRNPAQLQALYRRYVPDLVDRPIMQFFEKTYGVWLALSGIALFALGGWPMLLWGLCVRLVIAYHSTWFVNSATHLWGYRNYETGDESRNLWWVAVLSFGEGWHNNHHAYPRVARAGHRWWEVDITYWVIAALKWTRLATDVQDKVPQRQAA